MMESLDDHLARVEQYGLDRRHFQMEFKGHHLEILTNDAHYLDDGRLLFDITLRCISCKQENNVSGRFPAHFEDHEAAVVNAKIALFDPFYEPCDRKT